MKYQIGEIIFADDPIVVNEGLPTIDLIVSNSGDRTHTGMLSLSFF